MRIIAFDPGEQTGYATGHLLDKALVIDSHGWDRWLQSAYNFRAGAETNPFDHCVYESWKLTPRGAKNLVGSDMPWSQFIGIMKIVCYDHNIPLSHQEPAAKYWLDDVMGGTSYLPKSDVEHNRDALRHLIIYGIKRHKIAAVEYNNRVVEVPYP